MEIEIDRSGTVDGFKNLVANIRNRGAKGVLVLSADKNGYTSENLDSFLQNLEIPVFGGIFPEIIYKNEKLDIGNVAVGFMNSVPTVHTIENISDDDVDIAEEMEEIEEEFETMFVFIDAFSTSIETVINEIYFNFGLESNFIGGGAGSLSFVQKPVLYTNSGLVEDGVTLTTIEEVSGIGVKHGWESIDGAFQITKANKNVIEELDYKPAFEVYKEVVEKHSNMEFREDNFFDIAKGYPFGISKIGTEKIVRDPISEEGGKLVCVGNVKDGDYVDILHGEKDGLVSAVKIAYSEGSGKLESDVKFTLFIDCISRVLYLEDSFQEELDAVATKDSILVGALTLGEIANTGSDYLEFYNKTAVVGVF
jgi:hypothetical protein